MDFENAGTTKITSQLHLQNNVTYSVSVTLRDILNKSLLMTHLTGGGGIFFITDTFT